MQTFKYYCSNGKLSCGLNYCTDVREKNYESHMTKIKMNKCKQIYK